MDNNFPPGRTFLDETDKFIAQSSLQGRGLWSCYDQFFNDLKRFKGNSNGFMGLSEYLVFRFLLHQLGRQLGSEFELKPNNRTLSKFVSKAVPEFEIAQCNRVDIPGKARHYYPDVSMWYRGNLIAIVQVKIYLTNGSKELLEELAALDAIQSAHPEIRALMVIFNKLPDRSMILEELKRAEGDREWFRHVILQDHNTPLQADFDAFLKLERILPTAAQTRLRAIQSAGTP